MLAFGCSIVAGEEIEKKPTLTKLFAEHINEPLENSIKACKSKEEILFTEYKNIKLGHSILIGISKISRLN